MSYPYTSEYFEVGEKVIVTRIARSYEGGWGATWNIVMNKYVGQTVIIMQNHTIDGYATDCGFWFPYFVLEPVNPLKKITDKIRTNFGKIDKLALQYKP